MAVLGELDDLRHVINDLERFSTFKPMYVKQHIDFTGGYIMYQFNEYLLYYVGA